jgi:hypothetical protein
VRTIRRWQEEPLASWKSVAVIIACLCLLLFALWVTSAPAWDQTSPSQHGRSWDGLVISGTNAAVAVTITPQASERARVYSISGFCSSGSASVSITNGGSFSKGWVSSSTLIGTTSTGVAWTPAPYYGDLGAVVVVTLGTCGGGNTGTLTVQADTF